MTRSAARRRVSRDRNGARWTLYGLAGGYTTASPVGVPLTGWQAVHAVPLLTFRSGAPGTDRYAAVPRLDYARGWAFAAYR